MRLAVIDQLKSLTEKNSMCQNIFWSSSSSSDVTARDQTPDWCEEKLDGYRIEHGQRPFVGFLSQSLISPRDEAKKGYDTKRFSVLYDALVSFMFVLISVLTKSSIISIVMTSFCDYIFYSGIRKAFCCSVLHKLSVLQLFPGRRSTDATQDQRRTWGLPVWWSLQIWRFYWLFVTFCQLLSILIVRAEEYTDWWWFVMD